VNLLRLLKVHLRPHRGAIVLVVVFQLVQTAASLFLPALNAAIIDDGIAKGDTAFILAAGGGMLGVTLVQIAASIAAVYFGAKAAMALGADLRQSVVDQVATFSEREVSAFGAPSLITRSTNDVQQVQMLVLMTFTVLVSAPIMALGGVVLALQQDLQLSWIIAVSVPVLLVGVGLIMVRTVPQFRLMQERIDIINRVLREQLTGIRVVRAFVRERVETTRFAEANRHVTETALRSGNLMALLIPVVMLVLNVSSIAVTWFGAFRIEDGSLQVGTMIAFISYLMQILGGVLMASVMAVMLPRALVCADRISAVLVTTTTVAPPSRPVRALPEAGTIELRGASFAYPGADQPVLRALDLRVERGQTLAVIGSTGSGKTTFVNLLPRLFDATAGSVLVDGVDVRDIDPDLLWSRIGLVPQRPYLFSGTVASNLRYGKADATDEELWRALDVAQAADFVRAMDGQLDAPIAQGGTTVSGGQRQRLAIARALVKRPEIYVFDDSFSALDLATDARLRRALRRDAAGATMVIVAQRVSTIVDADQIVVLEDGAIVGRGTHEELLESSPTYAEIVTSQLVAEEAA
jgi:ATP-binding cassette, subfamily B, multidrug efflux pump